MFMKLDKRFIALLCFISGFLVTMIGIYATTKSISYALVALGTLSMVASYFLSRPRPS